MQESLTPPGGSVNLSYNGQFDAALSYSPSVYGAVRTSADESKS